MNYDEAFLENLRLNERERGEGAIVLRSKPISMLLVTTGRCNLYCGMCSRWRHTERLEDELLLHVEKEFFPTLSVLDWQGGEVVYTPIVESILRRSLRFPRIKQTLTTNGLWLDRAWMDLILDVGMRLEFSIDSVRPGTYERIRAGGRFGDLIRVLELLLEREAAKGIRLERALVAVVMRSNRDELSELAPFAERYGFETVKVFPIVRPSTDPENIFLPPDAESLERVRRGALALREESRRLGVRLEGVEALLGLRAEPRGPEGPGTGPALACLHPWTRLVLDATRHPEVYPECHCVRPVGSAKAGDLDSAWNGEVMQEYRRRIVAGGMKGWCNPYCVEGLIGFDRLRHPGVVRDAA